MIRRFIQRVGEPPDMEAAPRSTFSEDDIPRSLNVLVGTGLSYTRPDGVKVISIASLGR